MLFSSQNGAAPGAERAALAAAKRSVTRLAAAVAVGLSFVVGPSVDVAGEAAAPTQGDALESPAPQDQHGTIRTHAALPTLERSSAEIRDAARQTSNAPSPRSRTGPQAATAAPQRDPAVPRISPEVFVALRTAAVEREADPVLLLALAWRESRFDPKAENPASSARGLMQFTCETWLEVIRDYGAALGLPSYAAAVVTDRMTGDVSVRDGRVLAQILALRDDPRLSAAMVIARLGRERDRLARTLRRPMTDTDLYLVHFLGPSGARQFLRHLARAPSHRASDYVGRDVVAANRSVFITRNGRHLSLREVYAGVQRTLGGQRAVYLTLIERMERHQRRFEVASAP